MARATRPKRSTENAGHAGRADASVGGLKRTFLEHLGYTQGRFIQGASLKDGYMALAHAVRDQLLHRWGKTVEKIWTGHQTVRGPIAAVSRRKAEGMAPGWGSPAFWRKSVTVDNPAGLHVRSCRARIRRTWHALRCPGRQLVPHQPRRLRQGCTAIGQ